MSSRKLLWLDTLEKGVKERHKSGVWKTGDLEGLFQLWVSKRL